MKEKVFKKKEYRSWDSDLLKKLTLLHHNEEHEHKNISFNQGSNEVQLGFNQGSNEVQLGFNQGSNEVQLGFNQGSNEVQLGCDLDKTVKSKLITKLTGNEKKLFFFIANLCFKNNEFVISEILGNDLNKVIRTSRNGRETALKRLVKKGLLERQPGKSGKNGILNLKVSELIKNETIYYLESYKKEGNILTNLNLSVIEHENKVQLGFKSDPYSSSNTKNTTTKEINNIPEEWKEINYEILSHIGFSNTQIKQLINLNNPSIVQESINHFAFKLDNEKGKKYDDPLNVLMGVLRKGQGWIEKGYRSPQEIAMSRLLETKKAELERKEKLEQEIFKIYFKEWTDSLTVEKIKQIVPNYNTRKGITFEVRGHLATYFNMHEKYKVKKIIDKNNQNYTTVAVTENNPV